MPWNRHDNRRSFITIWMTITRYLLESSVVRYYFPNTQQSVHNYLYSGNCFWTLVVADFIIVMVLFLIATVLVYAVQQLLLTNAPTQQTLDQLLHEAENEMGNVHDIRYPAESLTLTFVATLGLVYATPLCSKWVDSVLVFNTLLTAVYLLTPPTMLCLMFGHHLFNYIKGGPAKNSLLANTFLDVTALTAFFARFGLQMLRYLLVLAKLSLVTSFFGQSVKKATTYVTGSADALTAQQTFFESNLSSIKSALAWVIHHLFETVETMLIYYAQTGALCIVVVWLLSALYSYSKPLAKLTWYAAWRK